MMTKYNVTYSSAALDDLKKARKWYNRQQAGLGKRLTEDVKKTIASIARNPFYASVEYDDVRTALCNKFPYALHYHIFELIRVVEIVAIFHTSREPLG